MRGFVEAAEALGLDPLDPDTPAIAGLRRDEPATVRITSTTPQAAYRALLHWAERLNQAAYHRQSKGGLRRLRHFQPSAEGDQLIEAATAVLAGTMSVNDGMAMIHYGDTGEAIRRLADKER